MASSKDPDRTGHYHDKGQKDASKGNYNPPGTSLGPLTNSERDNKQVKSYDKGWRHTKDQKK